MYIENSVLNSSRYFLRWAWQNCQSELCRRLSNFICLMVVVLSVLRLRSGGQNQIVVRMPKQRQALKLTNFLSVR